MIQKISSSNFEVKDFQSKNSVKVVKANANPFINNVAGLNYSFENIQANYMPISFKGKEGASGDKEIIRPLLKIPSDESEASGLVSEMLVSSLPEKALLQGNYYNELSDDIGVLIGSDNYALLVKDKGVEPELLVHNFTRRFKEGHYQGNGFKPNNTDIVYVNYSVSPFFGA